MTSKIIVNNLESDAGINTITVNSVVTSNQIGIGTDNPDHAVHLYSGNLGIGKSEVDGYELVLTNNNINFSRDAKSFINQLGTGTISVRLGSSNTEVAEFTSDGLKLPSGKGIDFSATANSSGTMTSELLDDYEEGTFTPTFTATTSNPTVSYNENFGRYVKVGGICFITVRMVTGSASGGSGNLKISGLPFIGDNASTSYAGSFDAGFIYGWGTLPETFLALNNSTEISLYSNDSTNSQSAPSHLNSGNNQNYVNISGCYHVS